MRASSLSSQVDDNDKAKLSNWNLTDNAPIEYDEKSISKIQDKEDDKRESNNDENPINKQNDLSYKKNV